jgi:hypothetical protein
MLLKERDLRSVVGFEKPDDDVFIAWGFAYGIEGVNLSADIFVRLEDVVFINLEF